jgi:hypothetical protein
VSPMRPPHPWRKDSEAPAPRRVAAAPPRPLAPTPIEVAVCEAVFRYQLQQPLADAPPSPHYYLALQGRDPEATVLHRLRRLRPEVHPLSHCRVTARDGVIDRTTRVHGVILQVARLVWVHAAAVDVVGGYYCTHRHAAGFRYHVVPERGQWAVTGTHLLWQV